jgi:superfamily II DNA or RNA helicase
MLPNCMPFINNFITFSFKYTFFERHMNLKDIKFPVTLKISSSGQMIPLEFFGEVIPLAKKIQFKLGYFSSSSISTLSYGFAQFIYAGGTIDFLINHFVSENDYKLINNEFVLEPDFYNSIQQDILNDMERLNDVLTKKQVSHFYNCLRYLIDNNRISIIPVTTKNGEISHYKEALFWDNEENVINIVGSCNFTYKGIVCNGESFVINRSWGEASERANIKNEIKDYEIIFKKESKDFIYLNPEKLINIINQKSISLDEKQLLDEELNLVELNSEAYTEEEFKIKKVNNSLKEKFNKEVYKIIYEPRFPFTQGPREYQKDAYNNWVKKNYSGVFAMATGTGKTITSLNCLLNIYNETKSYRAIILVPSIALLNQWEEEVKSFNFKNILKVGGGNNWEKELATYVSNFTWNIKDDIVIISTYGSFVTTKFQKYFKKIENELLLIADEAHNMGANNIKSKLSILKVKKRIGLSATPKRVYDEEGTEALNSFFNDTPPYTYSFDMERALKEGFLAEYKYFPIIVELNEEELKEYIDLSKKLLKFFDFEKGVFKNDPIVEILLIKRKNIIHKANNKISCFKNILKELEKKDKLNYIFTYIPEGYIQDNEGNSEKILDKFILAANEIIPNLKLNSYTSEDLDLKDILRGFSEGKIDLLFAMKMLDEGVDVPRAEVGIFCSSTGNPRQFIQRRGRLLRKHPAKSFATIYDMVVIPKLSNETTEFYNMEKNMVKNEIQRVAYFASLSMNFYDSTRSLENVLNKYGLNLDKIINEL